MIEDKIQIIINNAIDSSPENMSRFYKMGPGDYAEHERFIGITSPTLRKVAKNLLDLEIQALSPLIQSPFNEKRLLALIIMTQQYQKADAVKKSALFDFYVNNIKHINNWNLVDSSAHHIIGAHLFEEKQVYDLLYTLAQSAILWERRIAIVATWYFIKKSSLEHTFQLAELLKHDSEDLIHKSVGWMLREAGKKDENSLRCFLAIHANTMPKTMFRYAIEHLPGLKKSAQRTIDKI
jgi:3-methyladenine DNA glycosylase AlkD